MAIAPAKVYTDADAAALDSKPQPNKVYTDADAMALDNPSQSIKPGFSQEDQGAKDAQVENSIANRKSAIDVNRPINPIDLTLFGGKKMLPESGRALAGGMEVSEGVPSDIALGIQNARRTGGASLAKIPSDIFDTLKGKRPAQFGDVYRASNIPILSSEPVASTAGLLTSASDITPGGAAANAVAKPVLEAASPIMKPIKSGVGKVFSALSGVPEQSMKTAMDNPEVLSKGYLAKEGAESGANYSRTIDPLIQDPTASVPATQGTDDLVKKLGFYTPDGASTRKLTTMSKPEQDMILDWAKRLDNGSGEINFNEVHKVIGEADSELQKFYKARQAGASANLPSDSFTNSARLIRQTADEAIKKGSAPEVGEAIDRSANYFKSKQANKDFSKVFPNHSMWKGITDALIGHFNPGAGTALAVAQSPIAQKYAIKGAATLGRNIGKNPALVANAIKAMKGQ